MKQDFDIQTDLMHHFYLRNFFLLYILYIVYNLLIHILFLLLLIYLILVFFFLFFQLMILFFQHIYHTQDFLIFLRNLVCSDLDITHIKHLIKNTSVQIYTRQFCKCFFLKIHGKNPT